MQKEKMIEGISLFLEGIGVDLNDQHIRGTPERVVRAWIETWASGYGQDIEKILKTKFEDKYDEMVIVKDIPFCSHCVHHLVMFVGKAKIGYLADGRIVGLSKLARVLDVFAYRLQIQERLTEEVAWAVQKYLKPKGVGVIIEAEHFCMTRRGVQKSGSITITSCLLGDIRESAETRQEFLSF